MIVKDPLIELLAIKLHEHDCTKGVLETYHYPKKEGWRDDCWAALHEEDREAYRKIARGEDTYGVGEYDKE